MFSLSLSILWKQSRSQSKSSFHRSMFFVQPLTSISFTHSFRSTMNLSPQPIVLPNNHHRLLTVNASPIAVRNKIKAIQARKSRLTVPSYYESTEIRPLNPNSGHGLTTSTPSFTVITAERLVDRSKEIRLDRIPLRQPARPSILSSASVNQPSFLWTNYNSSNGFNKQPAAATHSNPTTITPPGLDSSKNKSSGGKISEIPSRRSRPTITSQPMSLTPINSRPKSSLKPKSPLIRTNRSSQRTMQRHLAIYESDDEKENLMLIDEEFREYLDKAMVKCADWLIKYVFDRKVDEQTMEELAACK